jgi:hypothetical protein
MKGQQSLNWLLTLLMISSVAAAQDPLPIAIDVPESVDPNAGSGWLRIELAVLVDDRAEVVASEAWPPYPSTEYPNSHRRLRDEQLLQQLSVQYPQTEVITEPDGTITLLLPDPQQLVEKAKADALAVQQEALMQATAILPSGAAGAESNDKPIPSGMEPLGATNSTESSEPIALEMIEAPDKPTNAGAEWLSPFTENSPTNSSANSATSPKNIADTRIEDAEETPTPPPVLPESFRVLPVELLSQGLRQLSRTSPDRLQISTAWLQAPEVANLPIILDNSGDDSEWPQLQGFVQIRTGDTLKVGVNFWWNTDASYLPEGFYMTSPPKAPAQRLWRDDTSLLPLPEPAVAKRQATFRAIEAHLDEGLPLVEFVDPTTGFFRELSSEPDNKNRFSPPATWPWRHFIHVADTRTVAEGYVRYFDHPVLKIITTWQELTWGEVYQIGAADREREELEKAISDAKEAAANPTALPVSQVPPSQQSLR